MEQIKRGELAPALQKVIEGQEAPDRDGYIPRKLDWFLLPDGCLKGVEKSAPRPEGIVEIIGA